MRERVQLIRPFAQSQSKARRNSTRLTHDVDDSEGETLEREHGEKTGFQVVFRPLQACHSVVNTVDRACKKEVESEPEL